MRSPGGTRPHLPGAGAACGRRALSLCALAATLLALAGTLLAPASTLAVSSKAKAIRVEVPTPAVGDVTIEAITTTIPSHVAKFPELELFAANDRALPPSVIALTATRTQRSRRSTTFRTLVLVLDRRSAGATARAAAEDALAEYGRRLVQGDEPEPYKGSPGVYAGLSFSFTGLVPSDVDTWIQEQHKRNGVLIGVGVQPNASSGDTDVRACWALSDTIRLSSTGKPAPGVTYDFFSAPDALSWNHDGVGQTFVNFTRDCHAGAGGLSTAFTAVGNDLGLAPDALGPPILPPAVKPIDKEQAELIFFGAILDGEPEVAWKALEDYVLWMALDEFEEFFAPSSDSLATPRAPWPARAASASSQRVPQGGQVTKVEVRGYYAGGCPVAEEVCEQNLHFQDLRPLPDGELEVISTTQAFTLPKSPGTYSFEPTNFFVQKGDYIGLSTVGGEFMVLVKDAAASTDVFEGNNQDMNGDKLGAAKTKPASGEELNMRVTLKPSE